MLYAHPLPVSAHPSAAEPPVFAESECVVIADKRTQEFLDIYYGVPMEDTAIEVGDIPVADAKTHQFFALAGTVYQVGVEDMIAPFADTTGLGTSLPLWITHDDVQRAAAASAMASGVTEAQTDLPPESVLETRSDLEGSWLRISADDARRPITVMQSLLPVRWSLQDVPPGVYTVAGYVFSPPYNAWAPRTGVVKVVDDALDPPAGALDPINDVVFSYQGRKVRACLDVPAGTQLDAYYYLEESPQLGWLPWLTDQPVNSGEVSLCFHADGKEVVGSLRLRLDLRSRDGSLVTSLRSRDTLTWLQGSGTCQDSERHCCDFVSTEEPQPMETAAAGSSAAMAPPAVAAGSMGADNAGAGGCSAVTVPFPQSPMSQRHALAWLWLGTLASCGWRRRRRLLARTSEIQLRDARVGSIVDLSERDEAHIASYGRGKRN